MTPPWARAEFSLDLWTCPVVAYFYIHLTDAGEGREEAKMWCALLLTVMLGLGRARQAMREEVVVKEKEKQL